MLGQFAVGAYLFVLLPLFFNRPVKPEGGGRDLRLAAVLVVLGLLAVAALISFFHLGNPWQAPNALNNLKRSWLSREILFELATLLLFGLLALFLILRVRNAVLFQVTGLAAAATGLLFLLSMARIYMLPTVKPWNTFFTPASFFLTAFLLGAAAAVAASFFLKTPIPCLRALIILSITLAATGFVLAALAAPHFGVWGYRPEAGLKPPGSPSIILFSSRIVFLLAGAILLALQAKKISVSLAAPVRISALVASCFFFAAEVAGRFLFYGFYLGKR